MIKSGDDCRQLSLEVFNYLDTELKKLVAEYHALDPHDSESQKDIKARIYFLQNNIGRAWILCNYFQI